MLQDVTCVTLPAASPDGLWVCEAQLRGSHAMRAGCAIGASLEHAAASQRRIRCRLAASATAELAGPAVARLAA